MQTSTMKAAFKLPSAAFLLQRKCKRAQLKLAFKLPSVAFLMQIYEIFLFYASFWAFSFVFSKEKCKFAEKNKIAYGKVYQSIF